MNRVLAIISACVALVAPLAVAQPPDPGAQVPAALKPPAQPAAAIYDEGADAKADIAAALAKAHAEHRRVLIQWGGNWCGWCRLLHKTFKTERDVAKELQYEYDVVMVDIGHFDKNMDLASSYGADLKKHGVPFLTVLDDGGKAVVNQATDPLELADKSNPGHDRAKVLEFLKTHEAAHLKADEQYQSALREAKSSGRKVLLRFGAPWCGWCHRMDDWLAKPEVGPIIAKDFVSLKIDTDRMVGGAEMLKSIRGEVDSGIPWYVILDPASGDREPTRVATSEAPKIGNIGYPGSAEEIAYFMSMMKLAAKRMTEADLAALEASLKAKPAAADTPGHPAERAVPMTPLTVPEPARK